MDVAAVMYFEVIADEKSGKLTDSKKGFNSFCDLLTQYFMGAPTQTMQHSVDKDGDLVNFFGDAILHHLHNSKLDSIQQIYSPDGDEKHALAWQMVMDLVCHVAIEAFQGGVASFGQDKIEEARKRIEQLKAGARSLKPVPLKGIFG